MAAGGARAAPTRSGSAIGVLDKIEKVITHPAHFFDRHQLEPTEDASLAGKADIERLRRKIFTELQVLKKAHSLRAAIIPGSPAFLALREGTDSEFPIVGCINGARLDNATAWKTNETGFKVSD